MTNGLLWFDNSKKHLRIKITAAAKRYKEKYGTMPNLCYVNPANLGGMVKKELTLNMPDNPKITAIPKVTIMPNHIWLGVK